MIDGSTPLLIFNRESVRDKSEMSALRVRSLCMIFRCTYGCKFLFIDDNTRPRQANLVDEFLKNEAIERLQREEKSTDLNQSRSYGIT
ncbi:hypothetical protein NPIL_532181 [Nephila pilipes]|uniref:Uncharacterized protein n=1 Tax=Nephila pilipes TaxID=299642 RepID=A0A8X6UHY0_NEPPI|nr:hypothetical protein NPIL_532181 [Nephila pilipes]